MSYNTKSDEITVNDVVYDVERYDSGDYTRFTIDEFPGLEGRVGYDQDGSEYADPRQWQNIGTMAVSYRGYKLGDEDISEIDFEVDCVDCDGTGEQHGPDNMVGGFLVRPRACPKCEGVGMIDINPVEYFKKERGARVVIGLTVYEHSGITMRAGNVTLPWDTDRWDTSFVGFIFDTPESVKECMGECTDEQIEANLRSEVEVYASYLEGDITEYHVSDEETNYEDGCSGFVGDSDNTVAECFASMETAIKERLAEQDERANAAARDIITR